MKIFPSAVFLGSLFSCLPALAQTPAAAQTAQPQVDCKVDRNAEPCRQARQRAYQRLLDSCREQTGEKSGEAFEKCKKDRLQRRQPSAASSAQPQKETTPKNQINQPQAVKPKPSAPVSQGPKEQTPTVAAQSPTAAKKEPPNDLSGAACKKNPDSEKCKKARKDAKEKIEDACHGKIGVELQKCKQENVQTMDCALKKNAKKCEDKKKAFNVQCKDLTGPQFTECMDKNTPPENCNTSSKPERCERHNKAVADCRNKSGDDYVKCYKRASKKDKG